MTVTYLEHFGLHRAPFGVAPEPELFHGSPGHQRAIDWIEHGIAARAPVLALTGAAGSGKTTLLQLLLERHGGEWKVGLVSGLRSRRDQILLQARQALGLPEHGDSPAAASEQIRKLAEQTRAEGGFVVLMVDDAQALDPERMAALVALAMASALGGAFTLLLVGRPELRSLLTAKKPPHLPLADSAQTVLSSLRDEDTAAYIEHRLAQSGAEAPIFSLRAVQMLHYLGMGLPRFINILADYCLTIAAADGVSRLDRAWVSATLHEASSSGVLSRLAKLAREGAPEPVPDASLAVATGQPSATPEGPPPSTPAGAPDDPAPPVTATAEMDLPAATVPNAPSSAEPEARGAAVAGTTGRDIAIRRPEVGPALPRPAAPLPVTIAEATPLHPAPPRSERHGSARRSGLWPWAAAGALAGAVALAWFQPWQPTVATSPDTTRPADGAERAAVAPEARQVAPAQAAAQSEPSGLPPVGITPEPTVTALMQHALSVETEDPAAAAIAYARAALRGSARAAFYMGQLHETGAGVEANPGFARLWYAAAGDLPAARQRLQALSAADALPGAPATPVPIFQARLNTGASEMIWSVPGGLAPVRFRVEISGRGEKPLPGRETTVPGLIVPFPVSAWRVIAIGSDGGEAASPVVRMIGGAQ